MVPGKGGSCWEGRLAYAVTQLPKGLQGGRKVTEKGVLFSSVSCVELASGIRPVTAVQMLGKGRRGGRDDAVAIKCCNTNPINV